MVRMGRGETMSPGVLPWHMDAVAERYARQDGQTLQAAGQVASAQPPPFLQSPLLLLAAVAASVLDVIVYVSSNTARYAAKMFDRLCSEDNIAADDSARNTVAVPALITVV